MLCIHHNDHDGNLSAAIVYKAYTEGILADKIPAFNKNDFITFYEMDYDRDFPINLVQENDIVIIVDFSVKPDVMKEILHKTNWQNVFWVDHHKSADDYDYGVELPGLRDTKNKAFAGCELTWKWLFGNDMPLVVRLIGDYDKYALQHKPSCYYMFEGLQIYDTSPKSPIWQTLLDTDISMTKEQEILNAGLICEKYRNALTSENMQNNGYSVQWEGHKCFVVNSSISGSRSFDVVPNKEDYDIFIIYTHKKDNFRVSLYSDRVDVSKIAQKYGGGGHKGAAGLNIKELPF